MHSDDDTLAADLVRDLLRAGYVDGDDADRVVRDGLGDPRPRVRVLALRAGARRGVLDDAAWRDALVADVGTRREALALLARQRAVAPELRAAIRAALHDDDALVVDAAAFALGELGDVDSVVSLIEVATSHEDARCREAAIAALGALGDERGRACIFAALEDKPPVRRRAVVALANFEGPDVDEALARARDDRDWQVRAAADQLRDED